MIWGNVPLYQRKEINSMDSLLDIDDRQAKCKSRSYEVGTSKKLIEYTMEENYRLLFDLPRLVRGKECGRNRLKNTIIRQFGRQQAADKVRRLSSLVCHARSFSYWPAATVSWVDAIEKGERNMNSIIVLCSFATDWSARHDDQDIHSSGAFSGSSDRQDRTATSNISTISRIRRPFSLRCAETCHWNEVSIYQNPNQMAQSSKINRPRSIFTVFEFIYAPTISSHRHAPNIIDNTHSRVETLHFVLFVSTSVYWFSGWSFF